MPAELLGRAPRAHLAHQPPPVGQRERQRHSAALAVGAPLEPRGRVGARELRLGCAAALQQLRLAQGVALRAHVAEQGRAQQWRGQEAAEALAQQVPRFGWRRRRGAAAEEANREMNEFIYLF